MSKLKQVMIRAGLTLVALFSLVSIVVADDQKNTNPAVKCELSNQALEAMPAIEIIIVQEEGSERRFPAKLANTNVTRAAGFQRVCAATIAAAPILFEFQSETKPQFHMNNVVAPIDIAFITADGRIESIHAMQPYSVLDLKKRRWSSKQPVKYALEVRPGFYVEHQLSKNSLIRWELVTKALPVE